MSFFFLSIALYVHLQCTASDYLFVHCVVCPPSMYGFWLSFCPLCCMSTFNVRLLIIFLSIALYVHFQCTASDYLFVHCVVCPLSMYGFWLSFCPLCCMSTFNVRLLIIFLSIVLYVHLQCTASDYLFVHCVVCPPSMYGFWLSFCPLCCMSTFNVRLLIIFLSIVLYVHLQCTASDYLFVHCVVCPLSMYGFWLSFCPLCCMSTFNVRLLIIFLSIVLYVHLQCTASDYLFVHCVVCPLSMYGFWLSFCPLCCMSTFNVRLLIIFLSIVLYVHLQCTASDYLFVHCVVCPPSMYGFWLSFCPLCCMSTFNVRLLAIFLSIVLYVHFQCTASEYLFVHCVVCPLSMYGFWLSFCPLCCMSTFNVRLLIIFLSIVLYVHLQCTASDYLFVHCVVCPLSMYGFWLSFCPLCCMSTFNVRLLVIFLSIVLYVHLQCTASDYLFVHCVVCPPSMYGFWLSFCPLCCMSTFNVRLLVIFLSIVLYVHFQCTASDYLFVHCVVCPPSMYGFWLSFCPLCCMSTFNVRLLIIFLSIVLYVHFQCTASGYLFVHCVVCPLSMYGFWISFCPLCCMSTFNVRLLIIFLSIVLYVHLQCTASDYLFVHCVVCPPSMYGFWLSFCPLCCMSTFNVRLLVIFLSIVLYVHCQCTASDYLFVHCVVCPPSMYGFWLSFCPLCCMSTFNVRLLIIFLSIVLYVHFQCTASGYLFVHCVVCPLSMYGFWLSFCPLCCMSTFNVRLLIIFLSIVLYVHLQCTASDYLFVHCVVCPPSMYGFWLSFCPLCCMSTFNVRFWLSFCPLRSMSTFNVRLLIIFLSIALYVHLQCTLLIIFLSIVLYVHLQCTLLIIFLSIALYVHLQCTASDYLLVHCVVCPPSMYGFWLSFCPLCCMSTFNVRFWLSFCPLRCMSTFNVRLLIIFLSIALYVHLQCTAFDYLFVHCVVCPLSMYGFWLSFCPLRCMSTFNVRLLIIFLSIALYVHLQCTASDYLFVHCVVCPLSMYGFWLSFCPLRCMSTFNVRLLIIFLSIALYVHLQCTASGYIFVHCVVCPLSMYGFWLSFCPLRCMSTFNVRLLIIFLSIVLYVHLQCTASDYLFVHCVVCPPSMYGFWLSFCPLRCMSTFNVRLLIIFLSIVLYVHFQCTASDYLFVHCVVCPPSMYGFWLSFCPLCCMSTFNVRLLIICLSIVLYVHLQCTASDYLFVHCVVCPPSMYGFWLSFCPLCCMSTFNVRLLIIFLSIVLYVHFQCTASGYLFVHCVVCPPSMYGFWLSFCPLCCMSTFNVRLLIIFLSIVLYVHFQCTASGYLFVHCVVCPLSMYGFWLSFCPLCCMSTFNVRLLIIFLSIVLYVHFQCTASDYLFVHCVVCPLSMYGFWLSFCPLRCMSTFNVRLLIIFLSIVLYVHFQCTASDYLFVHCVVCPPSMYGFWLSFSPLCCMSTFNVRLLIIPLVSTNFFKLFSATILVFYQNSHNSCKVPFVSERIRIKLKYTGKYYHNINIYI